MLTGFGHFYLLVGTGALRNILVQSTTMMIKFIDALRSMISYEIINPLHGLPTPDFNYQYDYTML
jgi:hypothetical protein